MRLGAALALGGYALLIVEFGWLGLAAAVMHLAMMVAPTAH